MKIKAPYVKAFLILLIYFIGMKIIFIAMVVNKNTLLAFTFPTIVGGLGGAFFLYFFDREHLFESAKIIKAKKIKQFEEKYFKRLSHHGELLSTFIIGLIAGPFFASLAVHLLLPKFKYKYPYVILISSLSIFITMSFYRGVFNFIRQLS